MTAGENYYYGGLIRFDMTPKPAYFTIKELLEKTWHTEKNVTTSAAGLTSFKGFYGSYDVTIEANGKKITKELNLSSKANNSFCFEIK